MKQHRFIFATAFCLLCFAAAGQGTEVNPGPHWDVAPVGQAWPAEKLAPAWAEATKLGSTAVLVIEHGQIVAQWGNIEERIFLHSARKSLLSCLYGIAVQRKQIDLNDTLASLGIDDKPPSLTDAEKQAHLQDLLEARSGVYHTTADETTAMRSVRPERGSHPPGTFWYYNNWDFNTLGTVLQMKTGQGVFDFFEQEIARPLQMEDFHATDCRYGYVPESIHPAYRFSMTARDMARFGLLYLHNGQWNGKQIVPAAWIAESVHPYSKTPAGEGYGYLWWLSLDDTHFGVKVGPGAYSARGHWGEFIIVVPTMDMVVVHVCDADVHPTGKPRIREEEFAPLFKLLLAARPQ